MTIRSPKTRTEVLLRGDDQLAVERLPEARGRARRAAPARRGRRVVERRLELDHQAAAARPEGGHLGLLLAAQRGDAVIARRVIGPRLVRPHPARPLAPHRALDVEDLQQRLELAPPDVGERQQLPDARRPVGGLQVLDDRLRVLA
jgi:hypothetical protein